MSRRRRRRQEEEPDAESDIAIKDGVRQRDGYKCRECGMTSEEHQEKYGQELDVHRVLPGSHYHLEGCVTLCRACHGPKPKTIWDAITGDDVRVFYWNMYNKQDRRVVEALNAKASRTGQKWHELIDAAISLYLEDEYQVALQDELLMADGLW